MTGAIQHGSTCSGIKVSVKRIEFEGSTDVKNVSEFLFRGLIRQKDMKHNQTLSYVHSISFHSISTDGQFLRAILPTCRKQTSSLERKIMQDEYRSENTVHNPHYYKNICTCVMHDIHNNDIIIHIT